MADRKQLTYHLIRPFAGHKASVLHVIWTFELLPKRSLPTESELACWRANDNSDTDIHGRFCTR